MNLNKRQITALRRLRDGWLMDANGDCATYLFPGKKTDTRKPIKLSGPNTNPLYTEGLIAIDHDGISGYVITPHGIAALKALDAGKAGEA